MRRVLTIERGAPSLITYRPNQDVCCVFCNPAALIDYERVGVRVERLGRTLDVCDNCVEALVAAKRLGAVQSTLMDRDAADIGWSFLNARGL